MRPSGIGGQAVIEGVMMKNKDVYAVAVRKPDNEIVIEKQDYVSIGDKYRIFKLPILRGMSAFVESMILGTKILSFSASFFEEEEEVKPSKVEKAMAKLFKEKAESILLFITSIVSMVLAVGIFILLPGFLANLILYKVESHILLAIIEGVFRILIFIGYIYAISQIKDIKRMFMYHGAEHKTINCLEHGLELTLENVKKQSREHKRCGTSFMFVVMFVSIVFFIFIRVDFGALRYIIRVLLVPIIAGVSYEFIRFAGRNESKLVHILSKPGMWLQGMTTKEPEDDMIEVAIRSVEEVFDWRAFLREEKAMDTSYDRMLSGTSLRDGHMENYMSEKEDSTQKETSSNVISYQKKQASNIEHNLWSDENKKNNKQINNHNQNKLKSKNIMFEEEDELLRALDEFVIEEEDNES